jgi:4-hydroxy-tetrahydrodipicolinate reductase
MLRILHVGLGPLGRIIVADLVKRSLGHVVAACDPAPDIGGRRLSDIVPSLIGSYSNDVTISPVLERIPNWNEIDAALVTTSSDLARCAPTFRYLMRRKLPVVSTCEELLYPWLRHKALADELDALAKQNGGRLLGTGVNPGFMMDTLPVAVTAVCKTVRSIHVARIQDASSRRIPFQQKIGAGLDDAAFAKKVADGSLRHVGLGESLHFIARYLGFTIEKWDETINPVKAEKELSCALGNIAKGKAAGVRQVATAYSAGRKVITLEFQAAIGQHDPHDRVIIDGEPPLDLIFKGGVHGDVATSAITLNAIRPLMDATPGLHTMATIPIVRWCGEVKG